ncbi:MAG: crotonase/enoyl-CoA hydratase family protein [Rhodobacteraceae bacterium]|nr:crotonase/enoyl-CoA hydratase family protein [Paracoccaceae bacterium]
MAKPIRLDRDARGVATLRLTRADRHNALDAAMIAELAAACAALATDPAVRVVVLAAAGKSFCAGGDLGWMRDQMVATAQERAAGARRIATTLGALDRLPKPLIGRIQGPAFGGGIGLMSVCDAAVGAVGATFALTEVRLGLIPAVISPYVIRRIGEPNARRMMLSARIFDSHEAVRLGLLSRVVKPDALDNAVEEELAPFLQVAPGAVEKTKRLIRGQAGVIDPARVEASIAALVEAWQDAEADAGIRAFFAREKPPWAQAD